MGRKQTMITVENDINKVLTDMAFAQREYIQSHLSYDFELKRYGKIREGNDEIFDDMVNSFINNQTSHLSKDPLRCKQYLFVVCITMATRNAIEGGVNAEEAYNLSDYSISTADKCHTIAELASTYKEALKKMILLVKEARKTTFYSPYIQKTLDYIYLHLHSAITINEISNHLGLTPNYLSALFKKEITILRS